MLARFKGFLQEQARLLSVVSLVMERAAPEVFNLHGLCLNS